MSNEQINIGHYMARHNIVFGGRIDDRKNCAIVGTGKLGACVWQEQDDLFLQITNVDASPQSQMSSGIVRISSGLSGNSKTVLSIYDGSLNVKYDDGIEYNIYGGLGRELLQIDVVDNRKIKSITAISLEFWDTKCITNSAFRWGRMVKNPSDWANVSVGATHSVIYMSRGSSSVLGAQGVDEHEDITDETIFGYTLGVSTRGIKHEIIDNILYAESATNYQIIIANPSRLEQADSVNAVIDMLSSVDADYCSTCRLWWNNFWSSSYVVYHDTTSDYIENMYFVSRYILACGMLGKYPMHFITGVFRNNGDDDIVWAVAYWWYNQRCVYSGMLATGDWNLVKTQLDLYIANMSKLELDTRRKYPNSRGIVVAETMCWDGRRSFVENSPGAVVAEFINCTGLEIALKMYEYCQYSGDNDYLKYKFLPFAIACIEFQISHELVKNSDGFYEIPPGIANSRETYVKIGNPITEFIALKAILPLVISELDPKVGDAIRYKEILDNLLPFQIGGYPRRFLAGDDSLGFARTNWDDPCMEMVYPFNLTGNGKEYYNEIVNNYQNRIGRDQILRCLTWDNSAIWAARLGLGDEAHNNLSFQIGKSQLFANGIGTDGNCKYEFSGNTISSLNEMLLQSYDGVIRCFPAIGKNNANAMAAFKLHAKGGFVVESEYDFKMFEARFVNIHSSRGGTCQIYNPYGKGHSTTIMSDDNIVCTTDNEIIVFETYANKDYFINKSSERNDYSCSVNQSKKTFNFNGFVVNLGK